MIGTIIIQVVGYSASVFFGTLAVIFFVMTEGRLKPENANLFFRSFAKFVMLAIVFAWITRFLSGYAP